MRTCRVVCNKIKASEDLDQNTKNICKSKKAGLLYRGCVLYTNMKHNVWIILRSPESPAFRIKLETWSILQRYATLTRFMT